MVSVCYGKVFQEPFASWGKSGWHRHFCNSKISVLFGVVVDGYVYVRYGITFRRGSCMKLSFTNFSKGRSIGRVIF